MKQSLSLLAILAVSAASLTVTEVHAHGSGAGWGIAGGLIGASVIASAASRDRGDRVVYVNNQPAPTGPQQIVYDADGYPMVYNGYQFVYLEDNRRDERRGRRARRKAEQREERREIAEDQAYFDDGDYQ